MNWLAAIFLGLIGLNVHNKQQKRKAFWADVHEKRAVATKASWDKLTGKD